MIADFFIHDVQVLRAVPVTDRYGSETLSWEFPTVVWSGRGWLSPYRSQAEDEVLRAQAQADTTLFVAGSAVIASDDRVRALGEEFQVVSVAAQGWTPRDGLHHLEVLLLRSKG